MTRYARAKGSKASNERQPEEATPWHVMQLQMENQIHETKQELVSTTTVQNENTIIAETSVVENKSTTWTSFGSENGITYNKNEEKKKKNVRVNKRESKNISSSHENETEKLKSNCHTIVEIKSKLRKVGEHEGTKNKNLHFLNYKESNDKKEQLIIQECDVSENADHNMADGHVNGEKVDENNMLTPETSKSVKQKMYKDEKLLQQKFKPNVNKNKNFGVKTPRKTNNQSRMANSESFPMYINGKSINVVHYDGFLIKEKDAEELNKLKLQLIAKGIPRNEYLAVLKLERRKAEKSLARERKNVCYRCRKSGHNFSECPEIETDGALRYCFKCGSTEHTHLGCKVSRGEEYRYAQCFLCKEQGHIAKQCPDNPRGLYPKGGACHLCGDVTHFKKDCPKNVEEKEKHSVTVETFNRNLVEALDEELRSKPKTKKLSKNKIVNF